jgi:DNA-binding transcriptional regulator YiaG
MRMPAKEAVVTMEQIIGLASGCHMYLSLINALDAASNRSKTHRTTTVVLNLKTGVSTDGHSAIREKFNLSNTMFAGYLRKILRTLENFEQARVKSNAQVVL